jgi:aspartate aminotransferase
MLQQRAAAFSAWSSLDAAPADPILGLSEAFKTDANPNKVLLGLGAYRCDKGKPYILPCIREAQKIILEKDMDHEYQPIHGVQSYIDKSLKAAYGNNCKQLNEGRIAGAQSLSGTGSLRVGFTFLKDWYPHKDIDFLLPNPTWPLHRNLAGLCGYDWKGYRYYHPATKGFDFEGMKDDLKAAKDHSFVLLHTCAHNPTGVDPTQAQWQEILEIVKSKHLFCGFDNAYQGFASGDLDKDAYALRLFAEHTDNIMLFQSFAKNFGIYGERAGVLSVITGNKAEKDVVMSRIKQIARPIYSNPPVNGARLVDIVLGDEKLTKMWHEDLVMMSKRMKQMREGLVSKLKALGNEHDWSHATSQIGMFAYTGLNKDQVNTLREKHAIYMTMDGRISIAGLNTGNLDYVAKAFHEVTHGQSF